MLDPGSISTAPIPWRRISACARVSRAARSAASIGFTARVKSLSPARSGSAARSTPAKPANGNKAAAPIRARRVGRKALNDMTKRYGA